MRYWLVMPAAGASRRFNAPLPKQYAPLHGRTVIEWALAPFVTDTRCAGVAVAVAPDDRWWSQIAQRLPAVVVVPGGPERSESVRSGLSALNRRAGANDWVLVHDAARPCLRVEDRDALLTRVAPHPIGGLLAQPIADTLKRGDADQSVEQTVDRDKLWRAQTPQMFRYARLCQALDNALAARRFPTDEAQAFEWLGERPALVAGSPTNIKITGADDLLLAEALLAARDGGKLAAAEAP